MTHVPPISQEIMRQMLCVQIMYTLLVAEYHRSIFEAPQSLKIVLDPEWLKPELARPLTRQSAGVITLRRAR